MLQKSRALTSALIGRAMLHLGDGRLDDAWQDLLASHRLARLLGHGGGMIDQFVGVAIDSIASRAELVFLEQANYDAKQIMKCLSDLRALTPLPSLADAIDWEERFILLDGVMSVRHLGVPALEYLFLSNENNLAKLIERELKKDKADSKEDEVLDDVDWDAILRDCNKHRDELVAILREQDREKREKRFQTYEAGYEKLKEELPKADELAKTLQRLNSVAKTELIKSELLVSGSVGSKSPRKSRSR